MTPPNRRLGRGLSSLIQVTSQPPPAQTSPPRSEQPPTPTSIHVAGSETAVVPSPPAQNATVARPSHDVALAPALGTLSDTGHATESLHSRNTSDSPGNAAERGQVPAGTTELPIEAIGPGAHQPRRVFNRESIAQLAGSIARNGLVQPLVVRPVRNGHGAPQTIVQYELIAGERRWRASRAAGLASVPAIIREADDEKALELSLIENLQREDLNAIDRAEAYARYCREFGLKPEEVATRLHEDRTTVVNYLRLLELPEQVKECVARGTLSMGHARAILGVADEKERIELARATEANGLSVRALEELVRRRKVGQPLDSRPAHGAPASGGKREVSAHLLHLQTQFQQALGTKVLIRPSRGKGRGKIIVEYYSLDDFDRIMARLGVRED